MWISKNKNLLPNEEEIIQIKINLLEFASYDERSASMILLKVTISYVLVIHPFIINQS